MLYHTLHNNKIIFLKCYLTRNLKNEKQTKQEIRNKTE